jgi:opacity protein-like surface antigen
MRAALALALAVALLATACAEEAPPPRPPAAAAEPQSRELDWSERYTEGGNTITFRVHSFDVLENGWRADIAMTNDTPTRFEVGGAGATLGGAFGVMLFGSGDLRELEQRNAAGELPGIRLAETFRPKLPLVLEPGATWSGAMEARGALAAGRWVRVVFGALVPVGEPPEGFPPTLVWITDHVFQLE